MFTNKMYIYFIFISLKSIEYKNALLFSVCTSLTVISNAATPPSAIIGEHVGKEYLYTCDQGYIISGLGYPFIKCREYDYRVSSWDPTPQCLSK